MTGFINAAGALFVAGLLSASLLAQQAGSNMPITQPQRAPRPMPPAPRGPSAEPSGIKEYTTAGAFSFMVPAGVTRLVVEMYGAGGGGGGTGGTGGIPCLLGGSGGGAGAFVRSVVTVPGGAIPVSINVGAGGHSSRMCHIDGQRGGDTWISTGTESLKAGGGAGGSSGDCGNRCASGGKGGAIDGSTQGKANIARDGASGKAGGGSAGGSGAMGWPVIGFSITQAGGGAGAGAGRNGTDGQTGYVLLQW